MKSIKVCEYSRSRSFHYDLILQDQASGERSQDQWSSGYDLKKKLTSGVIPILPRVIYMYITILVKQVYWYISQVSGEHLHWSSGFENTANIV